MRVLIVVVLLSLAGRANAESMRLTPIDVGERPAMENYFEDEMRGGYVLIAMGVTELLAGTLMLVGSAGDTGNEYVRGMSYPLLGVGLAHALAGVFVNITSAQRVKKFGKEITTDNVGWTRREQKRMKGVSTQFFALKIVETVIAAGALTTAAIVRDDRPQLTGACIGLAGMMAATFVFDVFAAKRAHRYRRALAGITF